MPGGTEETWGCGTKGHGLVMVLSRSGRWLDLMTSKVISKQKGKSFKGALPSFQTFFFGQNISSSFLFLKCYPTVYFVCMHMCPSEKCSISNTGVSLISQMAQLCIGQRFCLITIFWSLNAIKHMACSDKMCRTPSGRLQDSSSSVSLLWQRLLVLQQPML